MQPCSLLRRTLATCAVVLGLAAPCAAAAPRTAIPPANCDASANQAFSAVMTVSSIDRCRARLGIAPLHLPSNWGALTPDEQLLTIVDLERTARGLAPILGLTQGLDAAAQAGADRQQDPVIGGTFASIWAGGSTAAAAGGVLESDYLWMYDDGWFRGGGQAINGDCTSPHAAGCWGHARNILVGTLGGDGLVAGAGYADTDGTASYALVFAPGSGARLTFSWAQERRFIAAPEATVRPRATV